MCLMIAISERFLGTTISFRQKRNVLHSQSNFAQVSKNLARYIQIWKYGSVGPTDENKNVKTCSIAHHVWNSYAIISMIHPKLFSNLYPAKFFHTSANSFSYSLREGRKMIERSYNLICASIICARPYICYSHQIPLERLITPLIRC